MNTEKVEVNFNRYSDWMHDQGWTAITRGEFLYWTRRWLNAEEEE